jgi:hypothetical protein
MSENDEMVGPPAEGVLEQAVDDDLIVFNPASDTYFTLNRTAREVWELADGTRSASEIAATLADRYGVGLDQIRDDIVEIISGFRETGLV